MTEASAVRLQNVRLRLGSVDFHFDGAVAGGRITAVVGPSGSGKSTLLNLIAGFETPDSGRIFFGDIDVTAQHPGERPLSLVFQDNNLFTHLDLFTNVGLGIDPGLKLTARQVADISSALTRVGLGRYEKRKPGSLSGGERQRAAFARTLVRQKPLLLLDEPFAALDPALRLSMAQLLLSLHREAGNSVILVTHDRDEVKQLADDVIRIENGVNALAEPKDAFLAREARHSGNISTVHEA